MHEFMGVNNIDINFLQEKLMRIFMILIVFFLQSGILLAQPVFEHMMLDVGTNKLFIEVRGKNEEAPLLIFLHGGPGNVVLGLLPFELNVGRQLEDDYLVAYVHQRGAGKSSPVPDSEHTFSRYIADVNRVVDFLTEKYAKDGIYLAGHSWGGMLSVLYAGQHQDKVKKMVLISTAMNFQRMIQDRYDLTLEWAKKDNNAQAISDLSSVTLPFESWHEYTKLSQWAGGGVARNFDLPKFFEENSIATQYPDWNMQQGRITHAMFQELLKLDLDCAISSLKIPALFISGDSDSIIPAKTMRLDYDHYSGEKEFVVIEDSDHLPFVDQPDRLAKEIRKFLSK